MDHPCGSCNNNSCNNGHGFDQKCPLYIEHEKKVLSKNIEDTRREFELLENNNQNQICVDARRRI